MTCTVFEISQPPVYPGRGHVIARTSSPHLVVPISFPMNLIWIFHMILQCRDGICRTECRSAQSTLVLDRFDPVETKKFCRRFASWAVSSRGRYVATDRAALSSSHRAYHAHDSHKFQSANPLRRGCIPQCANIPRQHEMPRPSTLGVHGCDQPA